MDFKKIICFGHNNFLKLIIKSDNPNLPLMIKINEGQIGSKAEPKLNRRNFKVGDN